MAIEQQLTRTFSKEENPLELLVLKNIEKSLEVPEDLEGITVRSPFSEEEEIEVELLTGKVKENKTLSIYSTFGSGGSDTGVNITHSKAEAEEGGSEESFNYGAEFWGLTSGTAKATRDNIVSVLSSLAFICKTQKKAFGPGMTIQGLNPMEKRLNSFLLLPSDPISGLTISPVIFEGRAIHWIYVLPITAEEVELTKTPKGIESLIVSLKELGNKAYSVNRPAFS